MRAAASQEAQSQRIVIYVTCGGAKGWRRLACNSVESQWPPKMGAEITFLWFVHRRQEPEA